MSDMVPYNFPETEAEVLSNNIDDANLLKKVRYGALSSIALAEVSPLNEVARLAVFGVAEGISRSPGVGALAYGLSTLGVEAIGAVAASYVLDSDVSSKALEYVNKKILPRIGIREDAKFSNFTKLNILQFGGSVPYMLLRQREDPLRTKEQNLRLGLMSSAWLAGACALQGALMAEGIDFGLDHPAEVGASLAGLTLLVAAGRKGLELGKLKSYYSNINAVGPQIEGIDPRNLKKAINDKSSIKERIYNRLKLPVLVPLEYANWINPDFFEKKGYSANELLYSSVPQGAYTDKDKQFVQNIFAKASRKGFKGVVFDYFEDGQVFGLDSDETKVDNLETSEGPARISQFYMRLKASGEHLENYVPNKRIKTIPKEEVDKYFDQIWTIYNSQFQALVDDHPIKGEIQSDELRKVLSSDKCLLKAYLDPDGNIISFGYLVTDLSLCPWLNIDYFDKISEGIPTAYCSGIASSKDNSLLTSYSLVNAFAYDMAKQWPKGNLAFECSNVSAKYMPKIVERCFKKEKLYEIESITETRYHYKLIRLSND